MLIDHDEPTNGRREKMHGPIGAIANKIKLFGGTALKPRFAQAQQTSGNRMVQNAAEVREARHTAVLKALETQLDVYEATSIGAGFVILKQLEESYPGSVRAAKEIDPLNGNTRQLYIATISTEPGAKNPFRPVTVLNGALPFELPDYPGSSVPCVAIALGEDGHGQLDFSRPKEADGSQFTATYEIESHPTDEAKEQQLEALIIDIYNRVIAKPVPPTA